MMTSSHGNIFRVTGPLCGEFTGHLWIPLTKASDVEPWCFLWSAPEQTVEQNIGTPVIWDAIALIMASPLPQFCCTQWVQHSLFNDGGSYPKVQLNVNGLDGRFIYKNWFRIKWTYKLDCQCFENWNSNLSVDTRWTSPSKQKYHCLHIWLYESCSGSMREKFFFQWYFRLIGTR